MGLGWKKRDIMKLGMEVFMFCWPCVKELCTIFRRIKLFVFFFYVLLTVRLSISSDNDQLDAHLLYFTIRLLYKVVQI